MPKNHVINILNKLKKIRRKKDEELKKKNGITLIALIITIIVMIILVAVTVTVALNGGIFQKAESGSKSTNIEAARERILVELANQRADKDFNGFKLDEILTELKKDDPKWDFDPAEDIFTAPDGTTKLQVKDDGTVEALPEGGNNQEGEYKTYTFKNLSTTVSDWEEIIIDPEKYYMIMFENEDGESSMFYAAYDGEGRTDLMLTYVTPESVKYTYEQNENQWYYESSLWNQFYYF